MGNSEVAEEVTGGGDLGFSKLVSWLWSVSFPPRDPEPEKPFARGSLALCA